MMHHAIKVKMAFAVLAVSVLLLASVTPLQFRQVFAEEGTGHLPEPFEIRVVDEETGRAVPMVEFFREGLARFITDSAGRIAIRDPGMMNQRVYLDLQSPGYESPQYDIFLTGLGIDVKPGETYTYRMKRKDIPERLYRLTGSEIYRDTVILGHDAPLREPVLNAGVVNHDITLNGIFQDRPHQSMNSVVYNGKIYWFFNGVQGTAWQQTNDRMAVAISELPGQGGLDPAVGVDLEYILDENGFPKEMAPFGTPDHVVQFDSVMTVTDRSGSERLVAHYLIFDGKDVMEHGLALYDDGNRIFEKYHQFPMDETWRYPHGTTIRQEEQGQTYLYFGEPYPNIRVPAKLDDLVNPSSYEAWTSIADGEEYAGQFTELLRDENGSLMYRWTKEAPPLGPNEERLLVRAMKIKPDEIRYLPEDAESGERIQLRYATVGWNPWREKWILLANRNGNPKEMWYSESDRITGPWTKAMKLIAYEDYALVQLHLHPLFSENGGQTIYFDGTITTVYTDHRNPLQLYENNQIMHRINLGDPRLTAVFGAGVSEAVPPLSAEQPGDDPASAPQDSGKPQTGSPQTGDNGIVLYIVLALVSLAILIGLAVFYGIKRRKNS